MSDILDMPIGLTKVRRAQATVLRYSSHRLAALGKSELEDLVWALSTVLVAARQGDRVVENVFTSAESVAHCRNTQTSGV